MAENRLSNRRRTVLKGQVVFNNRASAIDCTVRDLSDTGARIVFADVFLPPPEFELEIPSRDLQVQARLVWSRGATHGIVFAEGTLVWQDRARTHPG
jgi:hypothetical protein